MHFEKVTNKVCHPLFQTKYVRPDCFMAGEHHIGMYAAKDTRCSELLDYGYAKEVGDAPLVEAVVVGWMVDQKMLENPTTKESLPVWRRRT